MMITVALTCYRDDGVLVAVATKEGGTWTGYTYKWYYESVCCAAKAFVKVCCSDVILIEPYYFLAFHI